MSDFVSKFQDGTPSTTYSLFELEVVNPVCCKKCGMPRNLVMQIKGKSVVSITALDCNNECGNAEEEVSLEVHLLFEPKLVTK